MQRSVVPFLVFSLVVSSARTVSAWVYPEHRGIALTALHDLDPERRAQLEAIWAAARSSHEARLCPRPDEIAQGESPTCIDYAAWTAIAGDHSCSSAELVEIVFDSDWILDVADVTARLKRRLASAHGRNDVSNAVRNSDIELQRADPEYVTRAESNASHFLLPRDGVGTTAQAYASAVFTEGVGINALASYAWYHTDALEKARAWASPDLSVEQRAQLAVSVLADEAVALHFLQDVFAAGHVAGSWGDSALRLGTHDYYNETGLAVTTWSGDRAVLTGDAWMRPEDERRAARTIQRSIEQVLDAARGVGPAFQVPAPPGSSPGTFDICRTRTVPKRVTDTKPLLVEVLRDTPVPMLRSGLGSMPRFRKELGPFIGLQTSGRAASLSGGFEQSQDQPGATGGLGLALRIGFGLEGVMNESSDGLVFLDLGVRLDGASSNDFGDPEGLPETGTITSAIPSRVGYVTRLRLPFWLLPMDMLIATPLMLLISPSTLQSMAVTAANGGLIPWQAGIATPAGRFQFILGREVEATFYGYIQHPDTMVIPAHGSSRDYAFVDVRSIQLEFPVLEYRPFRSFSVDQSSTLVLQLFGSVDIPTSVTLNEASDADEPDLKALWQVGIRLSFDWRAYF